MPSNDDPLRSQSRQAMRVSTSGSRHELAPHEQEFIRRRILALPPGTTIITGACLGVDAFIARVAMLDPQRYHVLTIVPANRQYVDPDWRTYCHEFYEMPDGTDYRDRDQEVVNQGDNLIAFPRYTEDDQRSRRSGTWMTIRIARQAIKPVELFILDHLRPQDWPTT